MKDFIYKFKELKIPTLLGLAIIFIGITGGVFLVARDQNLITFASPDQIPQNITITNLTDQTVSISWQTSSPEIGFVRFGQSNPDDQTVLDDRDSSTPQKRQTHHVTLKNLLPQTTYQFKVVSGKKANESKTFTTANSTSSQNNLKPIIGSILNNNSPVADGIVYFSISGAAVQSAPVKNLGNFIIPMNNIYSQDSSTIFTPEDTSLGKLTAVTNQGQATALFEISLSQQESLKPLIVGQNLDFTNQPTTASASPETSFDPMDLNEDRLVNANDYAIVLKNFGRNPQEKKADLNSDGIVDQKDLSIISERVNQL